MYYAFFLNVYCNLKCKVKNLLPFKSFYRIRGLMENSVLNIQCFIFTTVVRFLGLFLENGCWFTVFQLFYVKTKYDCVMYCALTNK